MLPYLPVAPGGNVDEGVLILPRRAEVPKCPAVARGEASLARAAQCPCSPRSTLEAGA